MRINVGAGVPLSPREVAKTPVFRDWAGRLPANWRGEVTINAADIWGEPKQVHILQMTVAREGSPWPVRITLRSETADEAARRELWEELGLDTNLKFEINLSYLISRPVLASPGITNERAYMMRALVRVAPENLEAFLEELRGKKTGVTAEGEALTLYVQPAERARDPNKK